MPCYAAQTHTSSQKKSTDHTRDSQAIPMTGRSEDSPCIYSGTDSDIEEPLLLPRIPDNVSYLIKTDIFQHTMTMFLIRQINWDINKA